MIMWKCFNFYILIIFFLITFLTPTLSNSQESKIEPSILIDASSNNFPPVNFLDEKGELSGFGTDLADAVGRAVGVKIKHIHSSHWVEVLEWIDSGEADFIHDTGYTKDRDEFLDYSKPILEMNERIFVRPGQYDITGMTSLEGKKVACVRKHITHIYLSTLQDVSCHVVNTPVEGLYELIAGNVDAFVYPEQIVLYLAQKLRLLDKIKITGDPLRKLTWSMVVKEGNKDLLTLLNKGIDIVKTSGEYDRIYNKWWGKKLFSGYSKSEVQIIVTVSVILAVAFATLITLFFYTSKLRLGKRRLEKEISSRKNAESELRVSERKYRGLFNSIRDAIIVTDLNRSIVDCNPAFKELFGYSLEEIKGKKTLHLYESEEQFEKLGKSLKSNYAMTSFIKTVNFMKKNGEVFLGETGVFYLKDQQDEVTGFIGLIRDITERKKIEAELKEKSTFLDKVIESSALSTWIADEKGTAIRTNPACLEFFGATEDEVVGKYNLFQDVVIERNGFMPDIRSVFEKGKAANIVIDYDFGQVDHVNVRNATHKIINSIFTPIKDSTGKVTNVIIQTIDLTDIKRLENELIQSRKMESIGNLAGGIAHDFNNILSIIIGNNELIMEELPEWSLSRENCEEIRLASLRARDIVKQLLTFSRQDDATKKLIDLASVVKESLKLIRATIPANVDIEHDISSNCLPVFGNSTQMNQILLNLCNNAAAALPVTGGRIDIELCNSDIDKVTETLPSTILPGKYVRLRVRDNGSGMDKEILNRIFDPYFTTKDVDEGSGIGLSVVHGIVKNHDGHIFCESSKGRGTTFTILIPAKEGQVEEESEQIISTPGRGESVLYIDDEPSMAKLGRRHLETLGYDVFSTTDAAEALELIKTKPDRFDLVISDMAMPKMPGDQLITEILDINPEMPTIICTGYSSRMSKKKASEIGIKAFLMKPLNKAVLAKTVRKVLDEAKSKSGQ